MRKKMRVVPTDRRFESTPDPFLNPARARGCFIVMLFSAFIPEELVWTSTIWVLAIWAFIEAC